MPSPIGHALAGIAVAWGADLVPGARAWRAAPSSASWYERAGGTLTLVCGALAAAPDLDLLLGRHRTATHSLTAVVGVALVAGVIAALTKRPVVRVALMCGGAWATHLLMDLVAVDQITPRGIQLLWPFSRMWFIAAWNLFAGTERKNITSLFAIRKNAIAVTLEVAILVPIALAIWSVRVKALAGLSTELARGDHPAK